MGKKLKDFFKTPGGIGKFGLYTAVVGITAGWFIFPYALDFLLGKRLALVEGTEARDLWTKLPPLVTSIYLFNVTNPVEVQNGAKPIVEEIGPYCYLAYKEKVDLVDDEEDDTVSYTAKSTWYKLPASPDDFKKTGPVCHQTLTGNEIIVQPNAFLMAILLKARNDFPAPLLNFVNAALPGIWGRLTNVFMTATASELIFDGILINCTSTVLLPRVICIAVEQNSKALVTLAKNLYLFSFFGGQNGTLNEYRLTVKRGRKDLLDVGRITQINGNTELPFWKGECNKIYGTDSTIFPPHRRRDNSSFTAYIPELCRVVKGSYVGDTVVNGIKGHEYIVSFGKGGEDPMTSCYCSRPKKCPPGAVDITPCLGAPLTATFPHFFDAPEFQNDVIGLNPDRAKHATYGILQEASGVPLRGRRRVQISIELKKIPYVGVTSKLKGYMCPLLWIEEAFDLEGDLLSMVKYQLVLGLTAMSAVKWGLLILGAGLSIFGGVGKFMDGPNWKKMGRENGGNSPQNPPDLSKVEDGSNKKYRKLKDPKAEQQSRSIMFYKEKFRKADSSIQTEPLFYAVRNGRNLQLQKVSNEDGPTQKFGQDPSQTIIPLYSTEVEPDYQSQPILENNQKVMKSRIDSPENDVDQRFPLLNIVNNDEVYGSQGSRQYRLDGINYDVRHQNIRRGGNQYRSNVEDYDPKNEEAIREVSRYKSNGEDYDSKNQNIKRIGEQHESNGVGYDLKNQEIMREEKQYNNSNGESYNLRNQGNNIMRNGEQYRSNDVGYDLRNKGIMRERVRYEANDVQNYDFRDREIMNERAKQGRYYNDVDSRTRVIMEEETRGSRFHDDVDSKFGNRGIIEQGTRSSKFGNAGSRFENREILDEDFTNSRRNVVTRVENDPKYTMQREENRGEVEEDSKLKAEIAKLNARLNVLERMKENLSRVPRDQPREDGGKKGDKVIKVSERDDFGEENSRLEKEAEELGMDKRIFVPNQGGFLDEALKARNLKLEEEARKLRVELNVLRGLKNGQFPLKNRRDDGVQTDETLTHSKIQENTKNDDNNSTKGIIKKPNTTNTGLQSVVVPKPSVRFQHKVDLRGMHVGDKVFLEAQKSLKTEGDDLGYELNSREKFFGRQGATDLKTFEKTVEISEEFGRIDRDAGRKSVIESHDDISQRRVDTGDDDTKNTEQVGGVVRYDKAAENRRDIENNNTMKNGRGIVFLDKDKNMGRETYRETGSNVERRTNMERETKNVQHGTKDQALNKNAGEAPSTKPRESNVTNLQANKHITDKLQLNNDSLSKMQKEPTLKMTLPESMQLSGSRHFENEVLKVLRGEMGSRMREYESLGGGRLETAQKLLEPMEKVEVLSNIIDDNDKVEDGGVGLLVGDGGKVGEVGDNVGKLSKKVEEISKTSSSSSESQEDLIDKFKQKVLAESEILRKKYYDQITTPPNKRRRIQISSSTEDTEETTLDEDSNMEDLDEQLRKLSPETEKEEKDKLPDLKKVKIKKNWKKVLTIVHTSRQIYNYRQLEKRQLFGESVEDYLEDPQKVEDKIQEVRKISRSNSVETDSLEGYDSSRSIENSQSLDTPSLSRSIENTPSMTRRRPSLKYLERVESIESLLDGEGLSDARITVTGAFSGGILRRRLSRENSLSDENV